MKTAGTGVINGTFITQVASEEAKKDVICLPDLLKYNDFMSKGQEINQFIVNSFVNREDDIIFNRNDDVLRNLLGF